MPRSCQFLSDAFFSCPRETWLLLWTATAFHSPGTWPISCGVSPCKPGSFHSHGSQCLAHRRCPIIVCIADYWLKRDRMDTGLDLYILKNTLNISTFFFLPWMVLKFKTALARTTAFKLKIVYICSGLPFTSPGDLPDSGIEPRSPAMQADSLPSESSWKLTTDTAY